MRLWQMLAAQPSGVRTDYDARYLFEQPSGTGVLVDETGLNDGSYSSMTSVSGVSGNGLRYSGSSPSRADINGSFSTDPAIFALSGWFNYNPTGDLAFLIAHRDDNTALLQLSVTADTLTYQARSSTSSIVTLNSVSLSPSTWYHFVLNWNKTGTTEVWLNGVLVYTDATNFSGNFSSSLSLIGPYANSSGFQYGGSAACDFDLYTVYDGINLSEAEIISLYNEV